MNDIVCEDKGMDFIYVAFCDCSVNAKWTGDFSVGVEVLPDCFCSTAVVLNSAVWGIGFKFNNTNQLIVPNKIICLLAKTLPGICISGNPGNKNKETN